MPEITLFEFLYKLPWWMPICVKSSKREEHTRVIFYVMYGNKYTAKKTLEKTFTLDNEIVIILMD